MVMAGVNEDEVVDFAAFARSTGRVVRFIEFMPLDADGQWDRDAVYPAEAILAAIGERWPLVALDPVGADHAPAERFAFADGVGEVGVVASVTRPFCGSCNRLRLTADGAIRNCLFSDDEPRRATSCAPAAATRTSRGCCARAVWGKRPGHGINDPGFLRPSRSMSMIGG